MANLMAQGVDGDNAAEYGGLSVVVKDELMQDPEFSAMIESAIKKRDFAELETRMLLITSAPESIKTLTSLMKNKDVDPKVRRQCSLDLLSLNAQINDGRVLKGHRLRISSGEDAESETPCLIHGTEEINALKARVAQETLDKTTLQ